jgi:hypothetical protein
MHSREVDAGAPGQPAQGSGGAVSIHPYMTPVEQDGAGRALTDGAVESATYGWW